GPKRDPRRARRRLGEQHGYVVRPRLRQEEAVVAEAIALGGETDDRLAPCLQRHDGKTDSWAQAGERALIHARPGIRLRGQKGWNDLHHRRHTRPRGESASRRAGGDRLPGRALCPLPPRELSGCILPRTLTRNIPVRRVTAWPPDRASASEKRSLLSPPSPRGSAPSRRLN